MAYKLEILPLNEKDKTKRERQLVKNPKGFIVFVHGICHGAWCWENFINFFAEQGYQCYAVSLRGHGNSEGKEDINSFTLSDYVEDVKTVVDMCATKPFLVGHSMGGAVVQQYIGKYENTVRGAVLFAPATAPRMTYWDVFPKNKNLFWATLIAFGFSPSKFAHDAAFFTGTNERGEKVQRVKDTAPYEKRLQRESSKITGGITGCGDLIRRYSDNYAVSIPILVIGSYADAYFPDTSLKKTANMYAGKQKTALVLLDHLCHDMMLDDDGWETSAAPVLAFIEAPDEFVNEHLPK